MGKMEQNLIKLGILKFEALEKSLLEVLYEKTDVQPLGRFTCCNNFVKQYCELLREVKPLLNGQHYSYYDENKLVSPYDMTWPNQKALIDGVLIETRNIIAILKSYDFNTKSFINESSVAELFSNTLRACVYEKPDKEKEIQNTIETILVTKGYKKGIDYIREGKTIKFSGRDYTPDFVLMKDNVCLEVKLLREGKKSEIIEEINADITAYSKEYEHLLFVVYDLGVIRDVEEFKSDIVKSKQDIQVVVVKH